MPSPSVRNLLLMAGKRPLTNPQQIAGCNLWLDASVLGLADGTAVASWPNLSGASGPATAAGTARPTAKTGANGINSIPAVLFTSPNTMLIAAFAQTVGASFTVIKLTSTLNAASSAMMIVADSVTTITPNGLGSQTGSLTNEIISIITNAGSSFRAGWTSGAASVSTAAHILSTFWDNTNWEINVDGGANLQNASVNTPVILTFTGLEVGSDSSPSKFLEATVGEIILYNRALTLVESVRVIAYLGKKWGIAVT